MMGLLSRMRRQALTPADRNRLLGEAIRMHRDMEPSTAILHRLRDSGASAEDARALSAEAQGRAEREVMAGVSLPPSAKREINYYFLLGVTPRAAPDQIHRAYRRKAMEVHPDRHSGEFVEDQWEDLMTVVADASEVLTDPRKRRAYDVFWRQRSRTVAMRFRRKGDQRGDLQTRYLWDIAEMAELEEALSMMLSKLGRQLQADHGVGAQVRDICRELEHYESAMIGIRTRARTLPDALIPFSERVRGEMQRKERLVRCLKQLLPGDPAAMTAADSHAMEGKLQPAIEVLDDIRRAQNLFELGTARPFI